MRTASRRLGFLSCAPAALIGLVQVAAAQQPGARTQRLQNTRDMHVACVARDSTRSFERGVGNDRQSSTLQTAGDSTPTIRGGTARSHEYPEYDVVLDVPNLCVERIHLNVDSVTARINLNAAVSNLVHVSAGADVLIGDVDLTIQDVRARALLLVDLDDVVHVVDQTLTFVDNHPEVVDKLTGTLQNAGGAVGGVVGNVVNGVENLLLGSSKLSNGNVLQHLVDKTTGALVDKTLSSAGKVLAQKTVGNILKLPTLNETKNAAGQVVRQVKDAAGNVIEYTLDTAGKLAGVRLLK